jgi:hypothetical protein
VLLGGVLGVMHLSLWEISVAVEKRVRFAVFWTFIVMVLLAWRKRITLAETMVIMFGYAIALGFAQWKP